MELLLAYHGSRTAREATASLERCALPPGATVTVLTVEAEAMVEQVDEDQEDGMLVLAHPRAVVSAEELASSAATQVASLLPDVRVRSEWCVGDPATTIVQFASRSNSSLIVLGTGDAAELGETARRVIRTSTTPLRLVRRVPDIPSRAPAHVVVAIDGSDDSLRLIHAVALRAWPLGSRIWLVSARSPSNGGVTLRHDGRIASYHLLWADMLRSGYLEVTSVIEEGEPGRIIPDVVSAVDAELVLLAAVRRPALETPIVTEIAEAIVALSPCPVEIW